MYMFRRPSDAKYLPWASRMLSIMDQWNSLDGHQLMIRAPRVVSAASEIFIMAQKGNVEGIQTLFTQKRASIYDVSSGEGRSVMHYALTGGQPNVVSFLLSQRANVNIEDKFALSPLDVLWNYLLEDPEDPLRQALRIPFESFLDETEDFQKRAFSPLHPIIFGSSKIDLASYLELSTDHIDDVCSLGRTPLCWAALRKSLEPVKTLIKFGASIDIADWRGQSPFHFSAETGNFLSLRILLRTAVRMKDKNSRIDPAKIETLYGEDDDQDNVRLPAVGRFCHDLIEARDYKGRSVLDFATRMNRVSHAGLLIRYGADLDSTDSILRSPLQISIYWNHHDAIRLLLENGASCHTIDANRKTVLHYAANFGDTETLRILREACIPGISPECRDSDDLTPMEIFDCHRRALLKEDPEISAKSREEFKGILACSRIIEVEESDTSSIDRWFDAFSSLEGSIASLGQVDPIGGSIM